MKTKLWELDVMLQNDFATAMSIYVEPTVVLCDACELIDEPPVLLEWEDGSDVVGTFVFCGARWVLRKDLADEIAAKFNGVAVRPVQFLDHPKLYRPKGRTRKRKVWLPYEGPELAELVVLNRVIPSPKSTLRIKETCPKCGAIRLDGMDAFQGMEKWEGITHTPRDPNGGVFISESVMNGNDFCMIRGTGLRLLTDSVKQFLESRSVPGIRFLEAGDVVPDE